MLCSIREESVIDAYLTKKHYTVPSSFAISQCSPITLKQVIPQHHAKWNTTKYGSDTTTKLMDYLVTRQPRVNLETAAVCRLLQLGFTHIHRISAVFTAKDNLNIASSTTSKMLQAIAQHTTTELM